MRNFNKTALSILVAIVLAVPSLAGSGVVKAEIGSEEYTFDFDDDTGTIMGFSSSLPPGENITLVIPKQINSVEVKHISDNAFFGQDHISNLILPETLESIGDNAFMNAENLEAINIPSGIKSLGSQIFYGCSNLRGVNIENGVKVLGDSMFRNCSSLIEVILPDSLTSLGSNTFMDSGLTTVTVPANVKQLKPGTFSNCHFLRDVTLPEGLTVIGSNQFYGSEGINNINLPKSLKEIHYDAFPPVHHMFSALVLENIEVLESRCLGENLNVKLTLPNNLKRLGGMTDVEPEIPSGPENIGLGSGSEITVIYRGEKDASGSPVINPAFEEMGIDGLIKKYLVEPSTGLTNLNLDQSAIDSLQPGGEPVTLNVTNTYPELPEVLKSQTDKVEYSPVNITWSSDKPDIASVDSKGKVTPLKPGTAVITAQLNNAKGTCRVTVKGGSLDIKLPSGMALNDASEKALSNTEPIKSALAGGKDVSVTFLQEAIAPEDLPQAEREAIINALEENMEAAAFYNISIQAVIDGVTNNITETAGELELSFPAADLKDAGEYKVARYHDGSVVLLDAALTSDHSKLKAKSRLFSTYAVIYDYGRDNSGGKGDNNDTSGDTSENPDEILTETEEITETVITNKESGKVKNAQISGSSSTADDSAIAYYMLILFIAAITVISLLPRICRRFRHTLYDCSNRNV